jgi:23S rRNA pseudoU1915 N3-methylase RlmH
VEFEFFEYADPLEPLVQTDLMKLDGVSNNQGAPAEQSNKLLGMRVELTLPSSAYAIALRELMKRPTSSEFQGELKLQTDEAEADSTEVVADEAEADSTEVVADEAEADSTEVVADEAEADSTEVVAS